MSDLFWPGDERAGDHFSAAALLGAMLRVEEAWLDVLVEHGVAPPAARAALGVGLSRTEELAAAAGATGSPVPALVAMLRADLELPLETGRWVHRGLGTQDVVDSALVWMLRAAQRDLRLSMEQQVALLVDLARGHRDTPMLARPLTQHAVPTTFGLTVASWLTGLLDAHDDLVALDLPVQLGGSAGTMAAAVELGLDPAAVRAGLAERLGLLDAPPWHRARAVLTRAGDALVRCTDAWGRLAGDVLALGRPETGVLSAGGAGGAGGGGGPSTTSHPATPVLATLVRRAALANPQLGATLHLAAAEQVDGGGGGAWHAEWATLRDLVRRTLVAADQTVDLVAGLVVHPDAMAATLAGARDDVAAEQRTMARLVGREPAAHYLGQAGALVDAAVARAHRTLEAPR